MADQVTALRVYHDLGEEAAGSGRPGPAGVSLREVSGFSLTQFACWPDTLIEVGAMAARAAGCDAAPGPGQVATGARGSLLRVEPLKWWLIREADSAPIADMPAELGAALELSSARTWVRVEGPEASRLLNHFLPLDLRPDAFPRDRVASTAFHHVGITLWRSGGAFELALPRSFAASLWKLLVDSARQYGLVTGEAAYALADGGEK
ncbi:sarcosine oxidase subunit gamma [Roseovarius sp. CH_XMU1461]|uniref:sarcosine oxidase subunit gamma n=1 Tax=Roseovarius sp. CH_XMU1461 TaxID=3107777 RepID=UPI00300BC71D